MTNALYKLIVITIVCLIPLRAASQTPQTTDSEEPSPGASLPNQPEDDRFALGNHVLRPGTARRLAIQAPLVPFYWFFMCIMHEGSHAALANAFGAQVTAFRPYPHVSPSGNFRFAAYYLDDTEMSGSQKAWVNAAPLMMDIALFTVADLSLTYSVSPTSHAAPAFLIAFLLMPTIDFAMNICSVDSESDVNRLVRYTGIHKAAWVVLGSHVIAAGIWRIAHHAKRIFFEKRRPRLNLGDRVAILPQFGGGLTGLALRTTF